MKNTLLNILCGILCAALLVGALCIGAVRGWSREREAVITAFSSGGMELLEERAMDAANLIVVASRHLDASDEQFARLKELRAILSSPAEHAGEVVQADEELSELAASLAQSLPELASVKASARDQAYVSTLTRTLMEPSTLEESYADLAFSYNNRLTNSPTGWVARLFGVSLIKVP